MLIKNRNLFRVTRFVLLQLPVFFRFFARFRSPQKRLLIIKTDAIGDYILFRNFIEIVRLSDVYKDYRIDLLGNSLWQDIALKYEAEFINEFYFIRHNELYESPLTVFRWGWLLFKNNYRVVLHPSSTRLLITDGLAALTAAKQITGFASNNEGIADKYKRKTDRFYTNQLTLPLNCYFEFDRSRFFFENVLNRSIPLHSTALPADSNGKAGVIIFPGAGVLKRTWNKERFLDLIKLIMQHTAQPVYLAGGPAELAVGEYLAAHLPPGSVTNLIGRSSLLELIELTAKARLVVANETSAIHIAVATKTPSVCILGGGHFERFAPYPPDFENGPVCVFEKLKCYYCNWNCIYETTESAPYPCIDVISVDSVWDAVLPLLPQVVE